MGIVLGTSLRGQTKLMLMCILTRRPVTLVLNERSFAPDWTSLNSIPAADTAVQNGSVPLPCITGSKSPSSFLIGVKVKSSTGKAYFTANM